MGIFSRFFKKKDQQAAASPEVKKQNQFQQKLEKTTGFVATKIQEFKDELELIKSKLRTLLETNYQLGLRHIERGNISDAIFRFKFIKRFWPHCYDAYYQLAYCYLLDKRPYRAKKVLDELLEKCPEYSNKAQELLIQIDENEK